MNSAHVRRADARHFQDKATELSWRRIAASLTSWSGHLRSLARCVAAEGRADLRHDVILWRGVATHPGLPESGSVESNDRTGRRWVMSDVPHLTEKEA